jgi:hypothetical protein
MSKVMVGQNLHDIAIQEYGTPDAAFNIAVSNDIAVTDLLTPAKEVVLPDGVGKDIKTANYYISQGLKPATENKGVVGNAIGINFWTIEEDFSVIK